MKLIALILSILILALSMVPCTDTIEERKSSLELASDHTDHDHTEDTCSPLCVCSCCGCPGFVVFSLLEFEIPLQLQPPVPQHHSFYAGFSSSYFYSIWQPPKLS